MNAGKGVIMAGLGLVIAVAGFYFRSAAGRVATPGDVMWGLGRLFRDIDGSDIEILRMAGFVGIVIGGILLVGGVILMYRRDD